LPVLVFAIGFVIVIAKAKKLEQAPVITAPVMEEPVDDPYLARVRELVEKS
jgi:hypothetical protein